MIESNATESPLRLPPTQVSQLPNGLVVVVAERRGLPLVAVRLEIAAGSAHDPAAKGGLADFTAQLLRRGTRKRDADAINAAVERVGGMLDIDVDPDSTSLGISLPSEHLAAALDVLADLAAAPAFPAKEVQAAKRRTLAQLATDLDEPAAVAEKALLRAVFGGHPYGHPVSGWARAVKGFTRNDAVDLHRRIFAPGDAALFVVGDVDAKDALSLARRFFGRWAATGVPSSGVPAPALLSGKSILLVDKPDATQTQLRLATVGISRSSDRYFACAVAAGVLGGGFTSRLIEEIRVNRGLSYGASARFHTLRTGGAFVISTFTKTETTAEAVRVALEVSRGFKQGGPTAEELARTRTYMNGLFPLHLETNEQIAHMLADIRLYGLGEDWVERYRDRVAAIDAAAALAVGADFFPSDRYSLVAVGKARAIRKALADFGPVKVVPLAQME